MQFDKGIFGIYKPSGPTSHDIIDQIRKLSGEKRVGHAGTLDPFASGVLVVAIGREFTKQLASSVEAEKEYLATIQLGARSNTDDREGELTMTEKPAIPTLDQIQETLPLFVGHIDQVPPIYSAIKIKGTPAHRRVRQGQEVTLQSRKVDVKKIELIEYLWPVLKIKVICGKGVYIRAIARDIGQKLGIGGYLTELERTRVGHFRIEHAINFTNEK